MENIPGELRKPPPVTKFILASTVVVTVPVILGLLPASKLVFDPRGILGGEAWRIWTSWFYTPSSEFFVFAASLFMLYCSSNNLETLYEGNSADYAWQMFLCACAIMCLNIPLRTAVLSHPLLHFLIYRDSCSAKKTHMSILDIFFIPKSYLPFMMLALDLITSGPLTLCRGLTGILVAHAHVMWIPKPALLRSQPSEPKPLSGWRKYSTAPHWVQRIIPDDAPKRDDGPTRPGGNVRTMNGGGTMGFGYGLYNACAKCVGYR